MAKQQRGGSVMRLLAWFTGIVVSLVVGQAMVRGVLLLPAWLGGASNAGIWVAWAVGWIVVITTLVGAVMGILKR